MQLAGKSALITGGGRGIGRAIALAYAGEGAAVAVVARTGAEVEQVAEEIHSAGGGTALALTADLTQRQEVEAAVHRTLRGLGKIDILVNNAGGYRLYTDGQLHEVPVLDLTETEWRRVFETNLTTAFLCTKAVLPHMVDRRSGCIINMSSGAARRGGAGSAAYSASKAALERLTESLAAEVCEYGIAVNALTPGWVLTRPNDDYDREVHKRMRLPDDIGPAAVFLALQTPATMTGQILNAPDFDREQGIERPSAYQRLYAAG